MCVLFDCFLNQTSTFGWCVLRLEPKNIHHKDTCSKEIGLHLLILTTVPHSTIHTIGRTYIFRWRINKHALLITTTKLEEVRILLTHKATQVSCCKIQTVKVGWHEWINEPKDIHVTLTYGHFTHETESPWPIHFKHSHWWKRQSWSKFASHYAWGTNGACECKMKVKSTWIPTWHRMDHVSWSLGLFLKIASWR
jgi:hypothetical protein